MQKKGKGEKMQAKPASKAPYRRAIRGLAALAIVAGLGTGCGQAEAPVQPAPEATQPAEPAQWEPETVEPAHDTHDEHAGHDHGPGEHTH